MSTFVHVKIVGEPVLSRAIAYFHERNKVQEEYSKFCEEVGADQYRVFPGYVPSIFHFEKGKLPVAWRHIRGGFYTPYKSNKEMLARLESLPVFPRTTSVFEEIPATIGNETPSGNIGTTSLLGRAYEIQILWPTHLENETPTMYAYVPDVKQVAIRELARLQAYEGVTDPSQVTWKLDGEVADPFAWTMPEGLQVMTEAEVELEFAQEKVRVERWEKENVKQEDSTAAD